MTKPKFDPTVYKKRNISIWDEVAPRYHKRWASANTGPFQSTAKLVNLAKIKKGQTVLDLACGTGVVTKKIAKKVGSKGHIVGIDSSKKAISIAKKFNEKKPNLDFIICDAENFHFSDSFDIITCQYALFFFPNSQKALHNAKKSLKPNGTLAITVHGNNAPFFTSILDAVLEFIPDYIPPGSPDLTRFGTKKALASEVKKSGYRKIKVYDFVFWFSPGTFSAYWNNYTKYIAKPLKEKLGRLPVQKRKMLKQSAKQNTLPFTKKDGTIVFPWQVLILTAKK